MTRNPLLYLAAGGLALVLFLFVAGAPAEAGAVAGLSGPGAAAVLGVSWVIAFPVAVMCVPPLVLAALAEAWARRKAAARTPSAPGLGSRSGPGDTRW